MSPSNEREARRQVADAARRLGSLGLNHGAAGSVSLRWHRGARDGFLVTPGAMPPEAIGDEDIVWLPLDDEDPLAGLIEASAAPPVAAPREPSSEAPLHRALYRHCCAAAVVHGHAPFATTLSCLPAVREHGIPAFHYMVAMAGGDSIRCASYRTFGTQALADSVVEAMRDRKACLMAGHGLVAIGADLASAIDMAVETEYLSRVYAQSLQIGAPVLLDKGDIGKVQQAFSTYRR
ncbi:MAG: class II aldolase/adducin family protein [Burkholderiaceae bacterium]